MSENEGNSKLTAGNQQIWCWLISKLGGFKYLLFSPPKNWGEGFHFDEYFSKGLKLETTTN